MIKIVKLHKLLKNWLKRKTGEMKDHKWKVNQSYKGTEKPYEVGIVEDFVYAYDHPEYIHMILKIKGTPKSWHAKDAYKISYMTTDAKNKRVVNGQRPVVTGGRCFRDLMRKSKKKGFF